MSSTTSPYPKPYRLHVPIAQECEKRRTMLTRWEKQFLRDIQNFTRPTPKQLRLLATISTKCEVKWQ